MVASNLVAIPLPTSDLRHNFKEAKREYDQKSKWALGIRCMPGQRVEPQEGHCRPLKPTYSQVARSSLRSLTERGVRERAHPEKSLKISLNQVVSEAIRDSERPDDYYSAPDPGYDPDPEVFYSYDAPAGPRAGEHILGAALEKAVERFEVKETEKLVREYEFVGPYENESADGYTADDDYEIVEHGQL